MFPKPDRWLFFDDSVYIKRTELEGGTARYELCCKKKWKDVVLPKFLTKVFDDRDTIVTFSIIVNSGRWVSIMRTRMFFPEVRPAQRDACNWIVDTFFAGVHGKKRNVVVVVHGPSRIGKSVLGTHVKAAMQRRVALARLYEDFNPAQVGCDVNSLILRYNQPTNVGIIVVNEWCDALRTLHKNMSGPSRIDRVMAAHHTESKTSFNNFMDGLNNTIGTIALFTTTEAPDSLFNINNDTSLMRQGRVDAFIKMSEDGAVVDVNTR